MALIKCPECGKENVSDTAKACPECGYVLHQPNKKVAISKNVPFALSVAYTICVIIYATDYLWVFTSIMMLVAGLAMNVLLCPKIKIQSGTKATLMLIVTLLGSFFVAFDYNLERLEWGFFNNYFEGLGIMLALYQIAAVIAMILMALKNFMPQVNKNATLVSFFASGILGLVFSVFEVNYLANKWGTGSNAFYIWAGFVSLLWFVTQATNIMVDEEF